MQILAVVHHKNMNNTKNNQGFSLLELLLYIGLSSTILLVVSSFFVLSLQSRVKNQTIAEVEGQGLRVMQIISKEIKNATVLTSPTQGTLAASLSLNGGGVVFDLSNNVIRINIGTPVALTSSQVIATNLSFYNLSYTNTPGIIRFQFTLSHYNPAGKNEYEYSQTFYGSASLRDI